MRKTTIPLSLLAVLALARGAQAQSANSDYTTKAGDDCVSIAVAAYGDRRAVELIHKSNPSMGPVPHVLKPGTVLHLPPKANIGAAPDARVTFVRNKVTVQAAALKDAALNDPLFRTNRVSTANASSASVTFRDETQIRVGEESLVIILGDVQGASKKQPADATLVEGNLLAHLGELAGKRPLTVDTDSGARVTMSSGSALVNVDAAKTTRLAVHAGSAGFAGALSAVVVPKGFGSKAEKGKAPTPPKPLPAAPSWTSAPPEVVFVGPDAKGRVRADYADATASGPLVPKAASFRVRVARDATLEDLVTDTVVPASVRSLDAQNLPIGAYFVRISSIDDDKFESPAGATAKVVVARAVMVATTPGRAKLSVEPPGLDCAVDGRLDGARDSDATKPHTAYCSLGGGDALVRGKGVERNPGTILLPVLSEAVTATAVWHEIDLPAGKGLVDLDLRDRTGDPVAAEGGTAVASNGVEVTSVRTAGSKASIAVRFPATSRPFFVTFTKGSMQAESNMLRMPLNWGRAGAPEGKAPAAGSQLPTRGFELGLSGGFDTLLSGHIGRHLTLSTAYRRPLNARLNVALGPSVTLARYEPEVVSPNAFDPGPLGETSEHFDVHFAIPVAMRLFPRQTVSPYLSVGPELAVQRSTFSTGTRRTTANGTLLGGRLALGAQIELGPGWVFLEGAMRGAGVVSADPAAETLSGATFDLGYRYGR